MRARSSRQRLALWVGIGTILMWGSSFTLQKQVYAAMSAGGFLFARYLMMPLCAVLLLCRHHGWRWPRLAGAQWRAMAAAALVGQVLHVSLVTHGVASSTAFSSALILACGPVFTLLVLRVVGSERLGRGQIAGVALALAGVLVYLSDKLLRADWTGSRGDMLLLAGAVLFSVYSVQVKPLFERHGSLVVMCYTTLLAAPCMVLLDAGALAAVRWAELPASVWATFVWLSVVVAFGGWMLWGWVNVVRGVGRTAPLMYLMPPVAGLVAWVVAGESFGAAKLAGAVLALSGVAFAQRARRG